MNRTEAKTKNRLPQRELAYKVLGRETGHTASEVGGLIDCTQNAASSRLWELCLAGRVCRVDADGEMRYFQVREGNEEAARRHYQAEQAAKDADAWLRFGGKIKDLLPAAARAALEQARQHVTAAFPSLQNE